MIEKDFNFCFILVLEAVFFCYVCLQAPQIEESIPLQCNTGILLNLFINGQRHTIKNYDIFSGHLICLACYEEKKKDNIIRNRERRAHGRAPLSFDCGMCKTPYPQKTIQCRVARQCRDFLLPHLTLGIYLQLTQTRDKEKHFNVKNV